MSVKWMIPATLAILSFAACSSAPDTSRSRIESAVLVNGAGATFPYPIYAKWFDEFHKLHPDIRINYQSIGSGGGIRQLLAGTVDFGASESPMTDEQLRQAKTK